VGAFAIDSDGAPVNLATEAFGIIAGTYLTVALLDRFREQRERARRRETRDARLRYALAKNLAAMASRHRSSAMTRHGALSRLREEIDLKTDDLAGTIDVPNSSSTRLVIALIGSRKPTALDQTAIDDAAHTLAFHPGHQDADEDEMATHDALVRLSGDLERFHGGWDSEHERLDALLDEVAVGRDRGDDPIAVSGLGIAFAFGWYDQMEDLFNEHLALLQYLEDGDSEYQAPQRSPLTPLGEDEEQGLRAERISAAEVLHLVRARISPFGPRIPADLSAAFTETVEQQVDDLRRALDAIGVGHMAGDEMLTRVVEESIRGLTTEPDEGIEVIERSSKTGGDETVL
jgi:hypothetical protein